jgi:hypothetical protein
VDRWDAQLYHTRAGPSAPERAAEASVDVVTQAPPTFAERPAGCPGAARGVTDAATTLRNAAVHRAITKIGTPARSVGLSAGAGNGIRTRDPDLGKVVLYH